MVERFSWCGDVIAFEAEQYAWQDQGSSYEVSDDDTVPVVRHPIGYIRSKPRVRIKAWSRPMVDDEQSKRQVRTTLNSPHPITERHGVP